MPRPHHQTTPRSSISKRTATSNAAHPTHARASPTGIEPARYAWVMVPATPNTDPATRARIQVTMRAGHVMRSALALAARGLASADDLVELDLADAHGLRGHLDALVLVRELERLLERQAARRGHRLEGVGRRRTH